VGRASALPGYVEGKDKNEILAVLVDTAEPGPRAHEQQKMGIIVVARRTWEKLSALWER
jgi:hypothetical protein